MTRSAFTILEVAADWQEPMILQHITRPSTARANEQLDPWSSTHRHSITPISHTPLLAS